MTNNIVSFAYNFFSVSFNKWKVLLNDPFFRLSLLSGILIFSFSYALTVFVSVRNDLITYQPVGDLFLDLLPTINLEFLFTYGIYSLVLSIFVYVFLLKPELSPFVLKSFGLLFIFRSAFVGLTHFGPPAGFFYDGVVYADGNFLQKLIFKNDLFFSGHTAIPFLAFLIFKESKFKWVQLFGSILMGITVLLMHVHYSIDVFAAFFITYGVYSLSIRLFGKLSVRFLKKFNTPKEYYFSQIFGKFRKQNGVRFEKKASNEVFFEK
ncbi:MAG: phosphatase PAP2-related protein [Candidatus Gracilibacteria bacterium]|nr:phosphatase PAP2-related protein [Candidatus Gracilibacteria bacterium]